jgi:hypothetical protein
MKFLGDVLYGVAMGIGAHIGWGLVGWLLGVLSGAVGR